MQVGAVLTADIGGPAVDTAAQPAVHNRNDANLVARAQAGEARALREIYETYQGQVRAHLYRMVGPDCEVDDLTQMVFARAFKALDRFQGNSSLSTWLYRITANTTLNLLRQRFRRDRMKAALSWFNAGREAGCERAARYEAREEAQLILGRLRPDLRQVFVLYHNEGLTLKEISRVLDTPASTVGFRLTRARKEIKKLVAAA